MNDKPAPLVVDDKERIVRLLKIMLRGQDEIYTALSAREALDIMENSLR